MPPLPLPMGARATGEVTARIALAACSSHTPWTVSQLLLALGMGAWEMPAVVYSVYWDNIHAFISLQRGSILSSKHLKGHASPQKVRITGVVRKKNDLNVQI